MAQFALLVMLTVLPMLMLSGGETPAEGQPARPQAGTLILPSRHYMSASQAIVFKGAGIETVWPEFLWMALLGTALLMTILLLFRRSVAQESQRESPPLEKALVDACGRVYAVQEAEATCDDCITR